VFREISDSIVEETRERTDFDDDSQGSIMKQPVSRYKLPGHDDTVPHEGPLWHDDNDIQHFSAAAFRDGLEVVSAEEFAEIERKAGIEDFTTCAIHGDVAHPGVFIVQHRNRIEKDQPGPGYTVVYDQRFFDARDLRQKFAAHIHELLETHDYVDMPHAK